jgi:UDP-3-O-[3-hydroxymyristoyl] glucosamine N-acyltransferase
MQFTAAQIAQIITGNVEGNPDVAVSSFGKIEEATSGQLAFLANPKYEDHLYTTNADIIIVNDNQVLREPIQATLIKVPDAYSAFALLLRQYQRIVAEQMVGIQEPCYIHATVKKGDNIFIGAFAYLGENVIIGDGAKIYPNAYIGNNVTIGEGTIIHPGVKIYHDCIIGRKVVIHAGTVIGSDGFGFAPQADGTYKKVPQMGNVIIEEYVEIGSNATIDRATIGSTIIKAGAKIDNLVQIAHNVEVGNNTVIAALSGISGSTKIGNKVMIGGQAGLAGHITIGDGAKINAQSGVGKSLKDGQSVTGSPSYDYNKAIRSQAMARNLPEIEQRVRELEAILKNIKDLQV